VDALAGMNEPALAWQRDFARAAHARGFDVIWSLSFELLASICPAGWQQVDQFGRSAATAYDPPSTLVSPASADGVA
ncbi:hypothetical protein, partial [Salmonella sp. SAL4458]|uniref:non-contractile tail sheath protein n=1 Tax=Salmonella sp. SAL4458 TaxID=3159913 RepID=UPI00397A25F1